MLTIFFLEMEMYNFIQCGLYLDYILKKVSELFTNNILVYTGIFFCEKFLVEFITKKIFDNTFSVAKLFASTTFFFDSFFSQVLIILFYSIFFIEVCYILI